MPYTTNDTWARDFGPGPCRTRWGVCSYRLPVQRMGTKICFRPRQRSAVICFRGEVISAPLTNCLRLHARAAPSTVMDSALSSPRRVSSLAQPATGRAPVRRSTPTCAPPLGMDGNNMARPRIARRRRHRLAHRHSGTLRSRRKLLYSSCSDSSDPNHDAIEAIKDRKSSHWPLTMGSPGGSPATLPGIRPRRRPSAPATYANFLCSPRGCAYAYLRTARSRLSRGRYKLLKHFGRPVVRSTAGYSSGSMDHSTV